MINPDEKTTALGGVATGNIKAQLAANVTGTHKTTGEIPIWSASAPRIGKKVAVVARLLVISVKKNNQGSCAKYDKSYSHKR